MKQICSSDLISLEWIASLFHRETAYLTPLDIRLSIASQFRFLSLMCYVSKIITEQTRDGIIKEKLVSNHLLSNSSFDVQMDALLKRLFAALEMYITPSQSFKMFIAVLAQSRIHSAIHADAFTTSAPNINQYSIISNFYPLTDNASFHNVYIFLFLHFFNHISFRI